MLNVKMYFRYVFRLGFRFPWSKPGIPWSSTAINMDRIIIYSPSYVVIASSHILYKYVVQISLCDVSFTIFRYLISSNALFFYIYIFTYISALGNGFKRFHEMSKWGPRSRTFELARSCLSLKNKTHFYRVIRFGVSFSVKSQTKAVQMQNIKDVMAIKK